MPSADPNAAFQSAHLGHIPIDFKEYLLDTLTINESKVTNVAKKVHEIIVNTSRAIWSAHKLQP